MSDDATNNNDTLPLYGVYLADGESVPFADLYLDMFPEQYDVE